MNADWTGYIVLWSNIESAIGLIACSLPTLRQHIVRQKKQPKFSRDTTLVTFGAGGEGASGRATKGFRNPTDQGMSFVTVHASTNRSWVKLQDGDTDETVGETKEEKTGIRAKYTYQVETSTISETTTPTSAKGFGDDGISKV